MAVAKLRCLALVLLLGWSAVPQPIQAQAGAYTVQIAAFPSQEEAEILVRGLHARGLAAYWVKAMLEGRGVFYRVRLGKFLSFRQARSYAERLRHSGLINQYVIFAYDAPSSEQASAASTNAAPAPSLSQAEREAIIFIASRNWTTPAEANVALRAPSSDTVASNRTPPAESPLRERRRTVAPPSTASPTAAPPSNPIGTAVSIPPTTVDPALRSAAPPAGTAKEETADGNGHSVPNLEPPLLTGAIESQGGQLQLTIRNLDPRQKFAGTARVSLTDGRQQSETAPVQVELQPNEVRSFPLSPTLLTSGSYIMTIYDTDGSVRMIRGASVGAASVATQVRTEPADSSASQDNEITVLPKQIAATAENITIEFEITSQRPLGFVALTLKASGVVDVKQAMLTTTQGRIPFLVPVRAAETSFSYELRDDNGRILASGEDDLRRLARGGVNP
jgi:hypothetical protein